MFYIVTDTTDKGNAEALGLNHSPKLRYGNVGRGARKAYLDTDTVRAPPPPIAMRSCCCRLGVCTAICG